MLNMLNHQLKNLSIQFALDNDLEEAVKLLLSKGADLNSTGANGLSVLHYAVSCKSEANLKKILEEWLAKGYDINAKSENGNTPLLLAIKANASFPFVQLLIEAGADINAQSSTKKSAILLALENDLEDAVDFLLSKGADLTSIDDDGLNALHYAVGCKSEANLKKILEVWLAKGYDINVKSQKG